MVVSFHHPRDVMGFINLNGFTGPNASGLYHLVHFIPRILEEEKLECRGRGKERARGREPF